MWGRVLEPIVVLSRISDLCCLTSLVRQPIGPTVRLFAAVLAIAAGQAPFAWEARNPCGPTEVKGPRDTVVYYIDQVSTKPELLSASAPPRYPDAARAQGLQGRVVLAFIVNANGKVERRSVRVLQSLHPLLDPEAVKFIQQGVFKPACREGRPVRVQTTMPVDFNLAVIVPAADTAVLRPVLESRYADQDSAIARRDLAGFLSTLAPQYVVELRDGQRFTRPGIDSAIAQDMRYTSAVASVATVLESLRLRDDTVWATVVHRADRLLHDAQGQTHRWENGVRHDEAWVLVGTTWRVAALRERDQLYLRRDGVAVQ